MLERLFEEEIDVVPGGQSNQPNIVGKILRHLDGAGPNRAGAAEENNVFH